MKDKTPVFDNEIVKQGNSYCVRIPKVALEYLGFELGDTVRVELSKPKKENLPKGLLEIYKNTIKELENFSYNELNDCFFSFSIEINALKKLGGKEKERMFHELTEAFEKTIELQKGKNFLKKYKIFKKSTTKKNTEKIVKKLKKSKYSELAKVIEMQTQ
jgi:antitoxin component of MazEF toxin-antitoxin module